jgi:serine/threonine protein phosphatase 1
MAGFGKLFGKKSELTEFSFPGPKGPALPDRRVYVVGDIHGQKRLLDRLLDIIAQDRGSEDAHLVFVGDMVDRGEQSRQVLETLKALNDAGTAVCLMGNHERMMLDFIDDPATFGRRWLRNGGLQTLGSFGIGGCTDSSGADQLTVAAKSLMSKLGPDMENWLRSLPLTWQNNNLWVVHAAAHPEVPMQEQDEKVLLWGSSRFFQSGRPDEDWVVHGHTVVDHPTVQSGRVSVDTGAYFSGRLTAAVIDPDAPVRFLQS